ncbi:MAG TPA: TIGR03758 family integrating conjugative element protein, partial [Pseudomonas sp.]|nr:TIGR03758 family integrating conjugative element protein [Pseudomonas sp.]
ALRTAFVSWAEHRMTQRQLLGVAVRFFFLYLALIFLLLS